MGLQYDIGWVGAGSASRHVVTAPSLHIRRVSNPDAFVKLGILLMIAGYRKTEQVHVAGQFSARVNIGRLGRFMSYVINHPIAPRHFNIQITQESATPVGPAAVVPRSTPLVLCYSGGVDSTAGLLYALEHGMNVLPMWIDFGQRNRDAEAKRVARIPAKLGVKLHTIRIELGSYVRRGWKDWDFIVPGRNFLFVAVAQSMLDPRARCGRVYVCANRDERQKNKNKDKSAYFMETASDFFSAGANRRISVETPFARYSKSEIVSYWKRVWQPTYGISPLETTTCYYADGCGVCTACFYRAIFLSAGGYDKDPKFDFTPLVKRTRFFKEEFFPKLVTGELPPHKQLDYLLAVENHLSHVPAEVREYYARLSPGMKRRVRVRRVKINEARII
ncbi:MAG: 7-cyano-7-deazaguanine synthase [Patescibacteria group bacterium]